MDITKLPFAPSRHVKGELVYLSGQVGLRDGALVPGGIEAETAQAIANVRTELERCRPDGGSVAAIVDAIVFLVDMNDYAKMNAVYAKMIGAPLPTRTCIGVAALPLGARIEIKIIASY